MINQILDDGIREALYAASTPTANNAFKTFADGNKLSWTADVVSTRVGVTAMATIHTFTVPVDVQIVDGRSIRLIVIGNYTKTTGTSTTRWQIVVGGVTLLFTSTAIGNAPRTIDTYVIEININFRAGNLAQVFGRIQRTDDAVGTPLEILTVKTAAPGTWNKAISNNINIQFQTVTGVGITHVITLQQATLELL